MTRRINVRGTSGAGKSTFSADLARRLDVPWIELDALHHGPNWAAPKAEVFQDRVRVAMDAAPDGWVIDGSYDSKLGDLVTAAADTIVWIDPPFRVFYPRLVQRTMRRVVNKEELWNGNRETWRDQFASRESIFYWTIKAHIRHQQEWPELFGNDPRLVRLRSDAEAQTWLESQSAGR